MANIYDKWNKNIDTKALAKDVEEIEQNGGNGEYKEVPHGIYEVKIEKMELKESKKGDPMLSIWFKILSGEFKGNYIFYNQVITQGFQIHNANTLLRGLDTDVEIGFDGDYGHYNDMVMDVAEACQKLEFALDYGENKKGYDTFNIEEVFESE